MLKRPSGSSNIDWDNVTGKLRKFARIYKQEGGDIFDGISTEDAVSEAIVEFLCSPTQLGWNPEQSSPERFLWGVAYNKLRAHLLRGHRCAASLDDDHFLEGRAEEPIPYAASTKAEFANQAARRIDQIRESAKSDPDLKKIVEAILQTDGSHNINQQAAENAGIPIGQFLNVKRRLARRVLEALRRRSGTAVQETEV